MNNYKYIVTTTDDELYHYGVRGMKWGVRRNTKRLGSSDSAQRAKAVDNLKKHRVKASEAIGKLQKSTAKLEKRNENNVVKADVKAAKLSNEAARYRRKANGLFVSDRKAQKYLTKAYLKDTKAKDITARTNAVRAEINKNKMLIKTFERGINDIDVALANSGKQYVDKLVKKA